MNRLLRIFVAGACVAVIVPAQAKDQILQNEQLELQGAAELAERLKNPSPEDARILRRRSEMADPNNPRHADKAKADAKAKAESQ